MGSVLDALDKIAQGLKSKQVKVGFINGATYDDNVTSVAMVAASNEFGNPAAGVPPRPAIRQAIAKGEKQWAEDIAHYMKLFNGDADKVLDAVGDIIREDFVTSIQTIDSPPLSPVTVLLRSRFPSRTGMTYADVQQARKDVKNGVRGNASAKPLIWTGKLQRSIDYRVDDIESS